MDAPVPFPVFVPYSGPSVLKSETGRKRMDQRVAGEKSQVQVIARAAAILRALEEGTAGLCLGQIAQRGSLGRSSGLRIVTSLQTLQTDNPALPHDPLPPLLCLLP